MAAEPQPIPKGPTSYPIESMSPEDFEAMCSRLVRIEHPDAVSTAAKKDGGADDVLPDGDGGYVRCWQHKHMPNTINWKNLEGSLAAAKQTYGMTHYTFTLPRNLGAKDETAFNERFRVPDETVKVDYIGYQELQAMLNGSDAGRRVAHTFFKDVDGDHERTLRAIEAGGRLDTPEDAADRLLNIGAALNLADAYFAYPFAGHEADGAAPPLTPGTVLSFERSDGVSVSRIDVVPRDDEAMEKFAPQILVSTTPDEAGERAAAALHEALRDGTGVDIDEGVTTTFTNLPPALADMTGRPIAGGIQLGPAELVRRPVPPWDARFTITPAAGPARTIDVPLTQTETAPERWDDRLTGEFGGLHATVLTRWGDGGGAINFSYRFERSDASVARQLRALEFFRAVSRGGKLKIEDRGEAARPDLELEMPEKELPEDFDILSAFLANARIIEKWSSVEFALPEVLTVGDQRDVARFAALIRDGGQSISWKDAEVVLREAGLEPLRSGAPIRIEHKIDASVLGRTVEIGYSRLDIVNYDVVSVTPEPEEPGSVKVRLEPKTTDDATMFQTVGREPTSANKPPPPPPRKARKAARKKKR